MRLPLCNIGLFARQAPVHRALPRLPRRQCLPLAVWTSRTHTQRHFSASVGRAKDKPSDRTLPTTDAIDAAEKHMKRAFGDHATWSHEKLLALTYNDALLGPFDLEGFFDYALSGYRPGGGQPSFPLLTQAEFESIGKSYSIWAPAPYSHLNHSLVDKFMPVFGFATSNDFKEGMAAYAELPARVRALKTKIWNGMAPMTRECWLGRKMDDPENYRSLWELTEDILKVFLWLNHEQVQDRMRYGFNFLVEQSTEFEAAANLFREQRGVAERLNLAGMWAEYFQSHLCTMSNRTHNWLADRVEEVQTRAFHEYNSALERAGNDLEAIAAAGKKYYECVQDLNHLIHKADHIIDVPMTGFKGYVPSRAASDLPLHIREDLYNNKIGASMSWKWLEVIVKAQHEDEMINPPKQPTIQDVNNEMKNGPPPAPPRFLNKEALTGHYHEGKRNTIAMRRALRGERKPLGEEHWITILKDRMEFYLNNGRDRATHRWGFVCYRLTYNQTDEEWASFKRKLVTDVFQPGEWIEGYDTIVDMAGLEFIDGRDHGIGEGDVEAAKKHFKSTYTSLPTLGRLWTNDFLVVDSYSYASHMDPQSEVDKRRPPAPFGPCFGDKGGHVRLIDTREYSKDMIDSTAPGYGGELKVLSSLVLTELYPVVASNSLQPPALWVNARLHPKGVWVGHTTQTQDAWWEWQRIDLAHMTTKFFEVMRGKIDAERRGDEK